jgi:arginyl-tRNA synthetase
LRRERKISRPIRLARMNLRRILQERFKPALQALLAAAPQRVDEFLDMIRPAQDEKFGDYQANFCMTMSKVAGKPPRDLAAHVVSAVNLDDLCHAPEVAGPGFINLKLKDEFLSDSLLKSLRSERLDVPPVEKPLTYVVDFSSPNVAKPMHVGHVRSTVIGDAIQRTLRLLGHKVITDNHLGDWGTQFGMIIYGYKNFADRAAFERAPVQELSRLYRLVHRLVDYFETLDSLPDLEKKIQLEAQSIEKLQSQIAAAAQPEKKKLEKDLAARQKSLKELAEELKEVRDKLTELHADADFMALAKAHKSIGEAILAETAKLHSGDAENLRLWKEFLPHCRDEIKRVYDRLSITHDVEYGESFYQDQLAGVVEDLEKRGLAKTSDGATVVFIEGFESPMLIRKRDGAFLYSTSDLATINFREKEFHPDVVLYVVDHRQSEHFQKLFAAAKLCGVTTELRHISFGTVLGDDGKPFKTRKGDTIGLNGLLDEAENRAYQVICQIDDAKPNGAELDERQRRQVAKVIGIAAIKYADLSANRTSDYTFSFDKMLAISGNSAVAAQYSYARVKSIFAKGNIDQAALRRSMTAFEFADPVERGLALRLLRFSEALEEVAADYRPNILTAYLYDLASDYARFFDKCPVLKAEPESLKNSRLALCDLTARTIELGLSLLGIHVVERM